MKLLIKLVGKWDAAKMITQMGSQSVYTFL